VVGALKIRYLLIEYGIQVQKRGAWKLGQTKETNSSVMKISKSKIGHTVSTLTRQKISKTLTGRPSPKKGKSMSQTAYDNLEKSGTWFKKGESPSNKGKKGPPSPFKGHTKETHPAIMKRSIAATGKKRTDESKKKMSKSAIQKFKDHPELIEQSSKALKKYYQDNPEQKIRMREQRARMKFPKKDSKPELLTQSILKKHKISFKKHHNFKLSKSYHQADIVIEPNYVIEVFGDYWHCNPKKYDGESIHKTRGKEIKVKDQWKHDKYIINGMKKQGYKVLVVWESELEKELDKTTKKILKFAKS